MWGPAIGMRIMAGHHIVCSSKMTICEHASQSAFIVYFMGRLLAGTLLCCAEEECGSVIIDRLTGPRERLLSMLAQAFAPNPPAAADPPSSTPLQQQTLPAGPPSRPPQHTPAAAGPPSRRPKQAGNRSTSKLAQAGGSMSLSELSVSDPGMKEPQAWWSQVQTVSPLPAFEFPSCCM